MVLAFPGMTLTSTKVFLAGEEPEEESEEDSEEEPEEESEEDSDEEPEEESDEDSDEDLEEESEESHERFEEELEDAPRFLLTSYRGPSHFTWPVRALMSYAKS